MQKKFFSSLLLMILLNLLVKPIAIFGIDATVQNRIGTDIYGLYFSLLNLSILFSILLDLGINNYTTRYIAQHPHLVFTYFGKLFTIKLILLSFYVIFTLAVAFLGSYNSYELYLLSILMLNQFLITSIAFIRCHFNGLLLFKTDAIVSVLDRLLLIIFGGIILFTTILNHQMKIEWFIWLQTFCYLITFLVSISILFSKTRIPKFQLKIPFSFVVIKKSLPYALLFLLMGLYTRVDTVLLERIHIYGNVEAGIYAQGFRLLDAFYMFALIFGGILFPIFSKLHKEKNIEIIEVINSSRNLLLSGAFLISIVCHYNAEFILTFIYKNHVQETIMPFQFLMWAFIGMCLIIIYGTYLTALANFKVLNSLSFAALILNFTLNSYFIPEYGAFGAAVIALITQILIGISQAVYVHYRYRISFEWKTLLKFTLYVLSLLLVSYFLSQNEYLILIQIVIGVCLMFMLRLLDFKSFIQLLSIKTKA